MTDDATFHRALKRKTLWAALAYVASATLATPVVMGLVWLIYAVCRGLPVGNALQHFSPLRNLYLVVFLFKIAPISSLLAAIAWDRALVIESRPGRIWNTLYWMACLLSFVLFFVAHPWVLTQYRPENGISLAYSTLIPAFAALISLVRLYALSALFRHKFVVALMVAIVPIAIWYYVAQRPDTAFAFLPVVILAEYLFNSFAFGVFALFHESTSTRPIWERLVMHIVVLALGTFIGLFALKFVFKTFRGIDY